MDAGGIARPRSEHFDRGDRTPQTRAGIARTGDPRGDGGTRSAAARPRTRARLAGRPPYRGSRSTRSFARRAAEGAVAAIAAVAGPRVDVRGTSRRAREP